MTTYTFTGPRSKATRKGDCPTCGKPATRTATFERTVNPFNKHADGTPKTWAEVAADVQTAAAAWQPKPDEFEHEKCRAGRLAPPVAEPVLISADTVDRSARLLRAMMVAAAWLDEHVLPIPHIQLGVGLHGEITADVVFIEAAHVPAWADALGLAEVPVEDGGHCTYARMRAEADGLTWNVHAVIYKPAIGDRLGGAAVEWRRNSRTGKRSNYGTVTVAELRTGLARMGVAVTVIA